MTGATRTEPRAAAAAHFDGLELSARNEFLGWSTWPFLCAFALSLLGLTACRPLALRPQLAPVSAPAATTGAAGDRATVTLDGAVALVTVTSATGIGSLGLSWPPDATPAALTLHLYLHGLEELTFDSTAAGVTINVLSRPPYTVLESAAVAGNPPAPIKADSPYWAAVAIEPASREAMIPLADGYFAVQVPAQLLADAQGQLTVRWIDFYR